MAMNLLDALRYVGKEYGEWLDASEVAKLHYCPHHQDKPICDACAEADAKGEPREPGEAPQGR